MAAALSVRAWSRAAQPRARLLAVAVLCFVPFGLVWSVSGTVGTTVFVPTLSVVPDYNLGGTTLETGGYVSVLPGSLRAITGAQSPARLLLGVAILCFLLAAFRRYGSHDRLVSIGAGALLAADALAVAARASVVLLVLLAATLLAVPPHWRSLEAWRAARPIGLRR